MLFKFKKHFGQNFLIDQNVIHKIIGTIDPKPYEDFIEIGPGSGAITNKIEPLCKSITLIEIDKELVNQLQHNFSGNSKVEIIHSDILKIDLSQINIKNPSRVIGNLPYNISTPILFHCVKYIDSIEDCVFMLQKEVANRICADCDSKQYGRLSIMLQYYFEPSILFNVSASCFLPKPKVDSTIIRLSPHKNCLPLKDKKDFATIVRQAFSARRKTIANSLKQLLSKKDLDNCNIDPKMRPENLALKDYIDISNYYTELKR